MIDTVSDLMVQLPRDPRDRRSEERFSCYCRVRYQFQGCRWHGLLQDISRGGMRLLFSGRWQISAHAQLLIWLPKPLGAGVESGTDLQLAGYVVWQRASAIGLCFVDPPQTFAAGLAALLQTAPDLSPRKSSRVKAVRRPDGAAYCNDGGVRAIHSP